MHLLNVTPTLSDAEKDFRAGIWFSVVSLERIVTVMTGRPFMINDEDCSVTLPLVDSERDHSPLDGEGKPNLSSTDISIHSSSSNHYIDIFKRIDNTPVFSPDDLHSAAYFSYYAQLNGISQFMADKLYHPSIRSSKWSDIQRRIQELDEKLLQ
jgi:hypothetical protein